MQIFLLFFLNWPVVISFSPTESVSTMTEFSFSRKEIRTDVSDILKNAPSWHGRRPKSTPHNEVENSPHEGTCKIFFITWVFYWQWSWDLKWCWFLLFLTSQIWTTLSHPPDIIVWSSMNLTAKTLLSWPTLFHPAGLNSWIVDFVSELSWFCTLIIDSNVEVFSSSCEYFAVGSKVYCVDSILGLLNWEKRF